jgi:hypothetical protein
MDRFEFQRQVATKYSPKQILNVGANEDPAFLKSIPGVVNCDITDYTGIIDIVFDCTEKPWPVDDASVECVIFGDIIEHLYPEELEVCLQETFRVANHLAATIPCDRRILDDPEYYTKIKGTPKGLVHVHVYEADEIKRLINNAGFKIERFDVVDYGFVPEGYLIEASRA